MLTTIQNETLSFTSSSFQGEPWALKFHGDDANYFWRPPGLDRLGEAVCFPLLGVLPNGEYELDGKTYSMPMHGFAHQYDYAIAQKTASGVVYELTDSPETLACFPFRFRLRISYALEGASLVTSYGALNNSDRPMPFSFGGHPRFACAFDGAFLEFDKPERGNVVKHYQPMAEIERRVSEDRKTIAVDKALFEQGCFCLSPVASSRVALKQAGSPRSITLQTDTLTHLQFWTNAEDPFLCMEPFFGSITAQPPAAEDGVWAERRGSLLAAPGEEVVRSYSVTIAR